MNQAALVTADELCGNNTEKPRILLDFRGFSEKKVLTSKNSHNII